MKGKNRSGAGLQADHPVETPNPRLVRTNDSQIENRAVTMRDNGGQGETISGGMTIV